jgi:hypothetical protein
MAPSITNIKLGSQLPNKSRNPMTFAGFVIPEMMSPTPKIRPDIKVRIFFMI